MRANPFVQKTINKALGDKIELLEFFEEPEYDEPSKIYYQIKLGYKNTIIYQHFVKEGGAKEPTKEEILEVIQEKINDFERVIKKQREHPLSALISNQIRIRFYEEIYKDLDYDENEVGDWIDEMEIWVRQYCSAKVEKSGDYLDIYNSCVREYLNILSKKCYISIKEGKTCGN